MYKARKFKIAVVNVFTKKVISRHLRLTGAIKSMANAGLLTHELIDL